MQSIDGLEINRDVDFVRRHKHQLAHFFAQYKNIIKQDLARPLLAYKIDESQFDDLGTLWIMESSLDAKSLRLLQTIEDSYMSTSFFSKKNRMIGSRGYIYYSSAHQDDDEMRALLRIINHLGVSIDLLLEQYPKHFNRWEFGVYAILDDIRYKLLLLDELTDSFNQDLSSILDDAVTLFYDYLQGSMSTENAIINFATQLQDELVSIIKAPPKRSLRTYKEADHPFRNLVFRDTLARKLSSVQIDTIIGIRFGGSELPHIMKKFLPKATILKVNLSNYSNSEVKDTTFSAELECGSRILILDDNILTGRTLERVTALLKAQNITNIYFGCVTYSGMKRYSQMIMKGHGLINTDVLLRSCVIGESDYTKITSSKSYKNSNGVFDKVKSRLQKRMDDSELGYRL